MKLTLPQLVALAARHGFPDPELAAAIAMAESGGETTIPHNSLRQRFLPQGTLPEKSIGLWQINTVNSQACTWNESTAMWDCTPTKYASWDLTDPDVNAQAAYEVTQGGTNWRGPYYSTVVRYQSYLQYYHPTLSDFSGVRPPVSPPSGATAVFGVALLAVIAAVAADEARARFA
jgi:hypothetical protein